MTLCEMISLVRFISNKSQRGNAYTPADFNLSLKDVNLKLLSEYLKGWSPGMPIPSEILKFVTHVPAGTLVTGVYTLPADFRILTDRTLACQISSKTRQVDLMPASEARILRAHGFRSLGHQPVGVIEGSTITVYPTNATELQLSYIRIPVTPIYDYYMDQYGTEVCMAASTTHALGTGEIGSLGQTSGTVSSLTVELEWDDYVHPQIAIRILEKLGVSLRESDIIQYSQLLKNDQ